MVSTTGRDRTHHAAKAHGIDLLLVEVQILKAPAHLLAGHDLALAKAFLCTADSFHAQHLDHRATGVQHRANFILGAGTLALVVHILRDFLDDLLVLAGTVECQGVVALGAHAHVAHIWLSTSPPHAVHLLAWVTGSLGFLERGGVHHAPAPQQYVVRLALAYLQPGGLLFNAGRSHRQKLQIESVHFGPLFEQGDGLLAKRAVMVNKRNFLAFEFVHAAERLAQVLDDDVGAGPVAAHHLEVPLEGHAVCRHRQAITHRQQRDLVARCFFGQGKGDPG